MRSIQTPDARRLSANFNNGLSSSVLGHSSMRAAICRFRSKSRGLPNIISVADIGEKFPAYACQPGLVAKNQFGESEMARFLPRKLEPSAPIFCNMMSGVVPPPPTGDSWNPVGAVRKKLFPLYGLAGTRSSELP